MSKKDNITWDYGNNGIYFVTICTKNRVHYFGNIHNGVMQLSDIGHFAHNCWHEIPNHFPFVKLGAFVVMPNHVHGIVIIDKRDGDNGNENGDDARFQTGNYDGTIVETQYFASLPEPPPLPSNQNHNGNPGNNRNKNQNKSIMRPKNQFGPQSQNLGSIIRGFKSGVTKQARQIIPGYAWKPLYDDRIIRDKQGYFRATHYIKNNPKNWGNDRFNGG